MAVAAQTDLTPSVVQGDMHRLPFADNQFDAILALFAINSSVPLTAMSEAYRTLKPGGSLILQEWGTTDEMSDLLGDTLADYAVDNPPDDLARKRRDQQDHHPWDELETSDDIVALMREAGFTEVAVQIQTPEVMLPDPEAFIRYKLAWPIRRAEFEAMSPEIQQLCLSDLTENLGSLAEADGRLCWRPNVVLVSGQKQAR
jgi:SAM-dependent methyltransferase